VAEVKASESDAGSDSESELERGRQIIDMEPSATVATTKLHPGEPDEPEEGERLFHSQMWVKGCIYKFTMAPKTKDVAWVHAEVIEGSMYCKYCQKCIRGGRGAGVAFVG
jgi:hypothetical protein